MTKIERTDWGDYSIYHTEKTITEGLVEQLLKTPESRAAGRGSIRFFKNGTRRLVCRKYLHGGLFRAITKDAFISAKRGLDEMEALLHLEQNNVPVVHPYAVISTGQSFLRRLYLVTEEVERGIDLIDFLQGNSGRVRLRAIRGLARLLWALSASGVYHPDLHLKNVLVLPDGRLVLLDFDRAKRRAVTPKDMEKMLWRLKRFIEKMKGRRVLAVDKREELLFLRVLSRLSGRNMIDQMARKLPRKKALFRAGWYLERLFYPDGT